MPKSELSRIEALEVLLTERRKHEGYLAKLEERRAMTPATVYARLRDEYLTKLTDLQVRAAAEAESLTGSIELDEAAVAEIEERLDTVQEERLEGELRAEVGEYDSKEWSKKLTVLNATIAQLEKELDARSGAFERRRSLLEEAMSFEGAPQTPVAPVAPVPPAARPSGAVTMPPEAPAAAETSITGGPSFDELAFLNSVVGRASTPQLTMPRRTQTPLNTSSQSGAPPRSATPVKPVGATPADATTESPEQSVVEPTSAEVSAASVAAPAPAEPTPAEPAPAVAAESAPAAPIAERSSAPAREPRPAPRGTLSRQEPLFSAPPASEDEEAPNPLGHSTPRSAQPSKTLKCQECGTLNYPTEWYCERCGGELAAL